MEERETAAEWLERAEDDASAARLLLDGEHVALAAFHAQQAAEKALKSVLIAKGLGTRRPRSCGRRRGSHGVERRDRERRVPVDFLCYSPQEFDRLARRTSIVSVALSEGRDVAPA